MYKRVVVLLLSVTWVLTALMVSAGGQKESASGTASKASSWPSKPITIIIPFGPGGSHDMVARVYSSVLPKYLGQPVIIKLMPGAGGQTGTAAAVSAKPDGYTLLFTENYLDQLQPLIEKLPYDTTKALVPVWMVDDAPGIVFVKASSQFKTIQQMLNWGRQNPGKLRFAHTGEWGAAFTPGAMMLTQANVKAKFIPFQGGGPATQAILAGNADFSIGFPSVDVPLAQAGEVRLLAVGGDTPLKQYPNVPTFKDLGYTGGVMTRVVMAPAKTPPERIAILQKAFAQLYTDKTFMGLMGRLGENTIHMDGAAYEKLRVEEHTQFADLVKKITSEQ